MTSGVTWLRNFGIARVIATLVLGSLVAVGCTSEPSSDAAVETSTPGTSAPEAPTSVTVSSDPSTATSERQPETTQPDLAAMDRAELLQVWARDRRRAIDEITSNGWGVGDDNVLHGPNSLRVDLDDCPADWRSSGPEGSVIPIVWWASYHWAPGPESAEAYLHWLGDDGLVDGRPIELIYRGEIYNSSLQSSEEQRLLQEQQNLDEVGDARSTAFAVSGFSDNAQNDEVRGLLDDQCLPSLGHRTLSQRESGSEPWIADTLGSGINETARAWAEHAASHDRITILAMDQHTPHTLAELMIDHLGDRSGITVLEHSAESAELSVDAETVLAADPEVVYLATGGVLCTEAANLLADRTSLIIVVPPWCTDPASYLPASAGSVEGTLVTMVGAATASSFQVDGTVAAAAREIAADAGPDGFFLRAADDHWLATWYLVETLKIAAELEGGLTRPNLLLAMWTFEGRWPHATGPVVTRWPSGPDGIQSQQSFRYNQNDQLWEPLAP